MRSEFYAPIVLDCTLPEFPVQQKFIHLPITQTNIHKYSLSSIELNTQPQIYTNYLLDQSIDIVNPNTYTIPDNLKQQTISPEDKIFLSQPDTESSQRANKSNFVPYIN